HWVAHRDGLKPHETPREHLTLWARAWGQSTTDIEPLLDKMGLSRPSDVPAKHLSAGQRRRTALARLHLEYRPVWLLDEPLTALDSEGRTLLLGMIEQHRQSDGVVVAAVHGDAGFHATREVEI
ncbi:MAG TPA: cytochrome c biogenesis ATP-binding export protein CcmA, partial [Hyphomonas sp.]|nr:cytochrome c biogenesis ATP-binding export protein CcmA [Hyphomonas sp.]